MDLATQISLLHRLGTASREGDWKIFYAKYAAAIVSFAEKQGLNEQGARDVLQETMLVVMRKLPQFRYDPEQGRFRNWILGIVANKVRETCKREHPERFVSLDADTEFGGRIEEPAVPASAAEEVESNWRQSLLAEALRRLMEDPYTKPETVAIFRAFAMEGRPAGEVAAQFGVAENAVYQIKNRLMTRLRTLLAELEDGAEPDEPSS